MESERYRVHWGRDVLPHLALALALALALGSCLTRISAFKSSPGSAARVSPSPRKSPPPARAPGP